MSRLGRARALHIDLTSQQHWVEEFGESYVKKYLGSRGIASYILYRDVPAGCDPLGDDSLLIFSPGLLTGTSAPTAGRTVVQGRSPATGTFIKSSMGGHWGAEFHYTGYDILVLHGRSPEWINLVITDSIVKFLCAADYIGLDTRQTTSKLVDEMKTPGLSVSCIGPAGENLVKIAGIMCDIYHTAARGGLGAVMGSKKVKAIGTTGRKPLEVCDVERFLEVAEEARQSIDSNGRCQFYKEYGTAGVIMSVNESNALPNENFRRGYLKDAYKISGQCLTEQGYLVRRESCFACNISCKRYTETKHKYPGSAAGGPEYENLGSLGAATLVVDMDANLRANELCNIYGLDTISVGSAIAWAMETASHNLLPSTIQDPDTGKAIRLEWGSCEALHALIVMIAKRQGLGELLAEGVKRASEKVGGDSWKWAVQAKGLEQSNVETRNAKAYALAFATNPRGPDHLYGQPMAEFGFSPEARALVKTLTGDEKNAVPTITDYKPEIVKWHENCFTMTDAMGVCSRATLSTYSITVEMMAELFQAAAGIPMSVEEFDEAAERVINIERACNVREGFDRKADTLPHRIMSEPLENPDGSASVNSPAEMDALLDRYYELRGWSNEGKPLRATLDRLGLQDVEGS